MGRERNLKADRRLEKSLEAMVAAQRPRLGEILLDDLEERERQRAYRRHRAILEPSPAPVTKPGLWARIRAWLFG